MSRITDNITRASIDIERIVAMSPTAIEALHDAQPGVRSTPTDTGGSRSTGDPSFRMLGLVAAQMNDSATRDMNDLARMAAQLENTTKAMRHLLSRWSSPATQSTTDVWCEHHWKCGSKHPRGAENRHIGAVAVCGWCYDWHRQYKALPSKAEVDQHARTGRVRKRA